MADFSVVIPNFNGRQYLTDCLESLVKSIHNCPKSKFEIVLVDNGSTDNSLDTCQKLLSNFNFQIIKNTKNLGFATAVNQGISASKYPYVCLLNNDLTLDPDWFKNINPHISPKYACYCGTILNREGNKIESQGLKFFYSGKCLNVNNGQNFVKSIISEQKSVSIWGSSAAIVVYQKEIIKNVGMFDKDFFAYEEDVDLALRLYKLGFSTLYIPQALSFHLGGGTSGKMGNFRNIHDAKNWIYIIIKNYSASEVIRNIFPIIEERLRNFSGLIKKTISVYKFQSFYLLPISLAKVYFPVIVNLPKMLKKRHQIHNLLKSR